MRPPLLSFLIPLTFQAILSHAHYDFSIEIAPRGIASNDLQAEENPELLEFLAANERQIPALKACPLSCTQTANSSDGAGWFLFSDAARLAWCNETMLLDFVVKQNPNIGIRACTAEYGVEAKQAYTFDDRTAALCSTPNHVMVNSAVRMFHPSASEDDQGFDSKDCGSLANKCGLKPSDFSKVNDDPKLCSTPLMEGQVVCCSHGKFPDLRPKPNTDGSCATYQTVQDDGCAKIAASRGLTKDDIEGFNKNTWGWNGCKSLALGFKLCVSEESPPMPEPVSNAVCGPTVCSSGHFSIIDLIN